MSKIQIAQDILLAPNDLSMQDMTKFFRGEKIDYADIYLQHSYSEMFSLENQIVKTASFSVDKGFGVRAIVGEKTAFAYGNDINLASLTKAVRTTHSIAKNGLQGRIKIASCKSHNLYSSANPLKSLADQEKINLLQNIDKVARRDSRIKEVFATLAGTYDIVLIANANYCVADVRPLVCLNISIIAEQNARIERGSAGIGGRTDYQMFIDNDAALHCAEKAVAIALINLEAKEAPAGIFPVVLASGWSGVLLHEAVGHGLEGDLNRKKSSVFANRIGQQVAHEACTIVDNGCLKEQRGSLNIDDEGTATQNTVLIEKGILRAFMQDKLNAHLMGVDSTGNGRRESYAHIPIPRMTNTYMLAGKYHPEEIINTVKKGIYAVNFSGGQVDITSGKFVFSTSEAYLIEHGKITSPIKGATLIGDGPTVLTKIAMVGNDFQLGPGIGTCGKDGQSVPAGVGQPTLKVTELVVGGVV